MGHSNSHLLSVSENAYQFSLVAQSCSTLCNPMDCSTSGFLSITNSQSLLKLMSIELVMSSKHLILCRPFSSHLQSFTSSQSLLKLMSIESVMPSKHLILCCPFSSHLQSFTSSQSLLKLMSIESVMPPNISSSVVPFSCLQSFPASGSFPMSSSHQVAKVLEFQLQHQSFQ